MPAATAAGSSAGAAEKTTAPANADTAALASVRPVLKETKTGAIAAKIDRIAEELSKSADDVIATLVGAGLIVPEKPREKPVFVEHAGEVFWLNRNARGELWLNAKASKFADKNESGEGEAGEGADADGESAESGATTSEGGEGDAEKKARRPRSRSKKSE